MIRVNPRPIAHLARGERCDIVDGHIMTPLGSGTLDFRLALPLMVGDAQAPRYGVYCYHAEENDEQVAAFREHDKLIGIGNRADAMG